MTLLQNCNTNIELSFPINIRMKFLYTPLSQNCTFCMSNVHLDYEMKSHNNIYQIQNLEACIVGYSSTYSRKTWLIQQSCQTSCFTEANTFFKMKAYLTPISIDGITVEDSHRLFPIQLLLTVFILCSATKYFPT